MDDALPQLADKARDRAHLQALGLGLTVLGAGLALSGIYERRAFAYGAAAIGLTLAVAHWNGPVGRQAT